MTRLCHNVDRQWTYHITSQLPMLVNINQREENLVKLSWRSSSPLIAGYTITRLIVVLGYTGLPYCKQALSSDHCWITAGSQMFRALDYFLLDHISPQGAQAGKSQLVSSCSALSMSQIVVSSLLSEMTAGLPSLSLFPAHL